MKKIYCLYLILVMLASCTTPEDKLLKEIENLSNSKDSISKEFKIYELKSAFASKYPQHKNSELFLQQSIKYYLQNNYGELAIKNLELLKTKIKNYSFKDEDYINEFKAYSSIGSIEKLDSLGSNFIQKYPKHTFSEFIYFSMAVSFENGLYRDTAKAAKYYRKYIETFPEGKMINDAKNALNNLHKTPDQQLEELLLKNRIQ